MNLTGKKYPGNMFTPLEGLGESDFPANSVLVVKGDITVGESDAEIRVMTYQVYPMPGDMVANDFFPPGMETYTGPDIDTLPLAGSLTVRYPCRERAQATWTPVANPAA